MLEIPDFWGPQLWTHVTVKDQIRDCTTHSPAGPYTERDCTNISCCFNSFFLSFQLPCLGWMRLDLHSSRSSACLCSLSQDEELGQGSPLQKASKMLPVAAVPPLLRCEASGQDLAHTHFGVLSCSICLLLCRGGVSRCLLE